MTPGTTADNRDGTASAEHASRSDLDPAPVQGKWGYIDRIGAWVIQPRFGNAGRFSQVLAPARPFNDWRWGYIDPSGEFVIQPQSASAVGFGVDDVAAIAWDDAGAFTKGYVDEADFFRIRSLAAAHIWARGGTPRLIRKAPT